jgi:SAM-dependent methyltransferase
VTWGDDLAGWWVEEVDSDPVYRETVVPMILELVGEAGGARWIDLGCGEGRIMAELTRVGARPVGCDASPALAGLARDKGPVVLGQLPALGWLRSGSLDGAIAILVLEHLGDAEGFFAETARVVRAAGALVVVANHPVFTTPGSGPIVDVTDGEVLWRWGPYLDAGSSEEPAGERSLTFHHRPLGDLLTTASRHGWGLERLIEIGVDRVGGDELPGGQGQIPRLIGIRWNRG